jgi:RND family efflux transporter MFP subunit
MNQTKIHTLLQTTQGLRMIMNKINLSTNHILSTSKLFAIGAISLGFTSNVSAQPVDRPTLDCLLEPYEVVEVSSAVEGVIEQIYVDRNDVVRQGQLLVELDSEVEKSQVALAKTRASLNTNIELRATELAFHERNQGRLRKLFKSDTISLHVKDKAETDTNKSRLQLRNAEDSQRLAELELVKAEAILALRTMRSPIDGVVVARNKVAGEFVEDQSILRLAQLDPLKVEVIVPAEMFGTIKKGMLVEVTPEYYGDVARKATITLVDRVIDPASGTFDVRAELPNPGHRIPSGLRCTVQFLDTPMESSSIANNATSELLTPLEQTEPEAVEVEIAEAAPAGAPEPAQARLAKVALLTPFPECSARRKSIVRNYAVLADPLANNTVTRKLVDKLKSRGITELFVVKTGQNQGHVSLGFYNQKPYAEERLAELSTLGFEVKMDVRSEVKTEPACKGAQQFADTDF